ncbi:hypothetical protein ALC62_14773 [Cyphomyrmex costatus]|uniref:GIY-YIG domain-containing protein n=1 Tax=Cyphomyrmex costatus TaxID=456900 RepID=A0A151I8V8_9HYME|nr:hypothetical protein ALC62_14773 [Cyphomyrmex costatus]
MKQTYICFTSTYCTLCTSSVKRTDLIINNRFRFDWYRKSTFSGRFLNFLSNHPISQKRGVIYSLVDRNLLLSDAVFHTKNLTLIKILLDNDYPLSFIFDTINQQIKHLQRNRQTIHVEREDNELEDRRSVSWLTVPYIPLHTEKFKRFNNNDIRVSFHSPNKMDKYIKVQKDVLSHTSKNNVVYRIQCNDCDASYVGQTGRQLKTRINEHRNHIRHNTSTRSVITDHRLQFNHDFQWEDVRILDEEPNYRKRLNIKKQKHSLNLQTDTEGLHDSYISIVNKV